MIAESTKPRKIKPSETIEDGDCLRIQFKKHTTFVQIIDLVGMTLGGIERFLKAEEGYMGVYRGCQ